MDAVKTLVKAVILLIVLELLEAGSLLIANIEMGMTLVSLFFFLNAIIVALLLFFDYYRWQIKQLNTNFQVIINNQTTAEQATITSPDLQKLLLNVQKIVDTSQQISVQQKQTEQSRDELITNISHDLRTPLTSIIGFLGLIEQQTDLSLPDIRNYVHVAYQKSLKLQTLVNDLFEYVRTTAKDVTLNISSFDMIQMLDQIAAEFSLETQEKGIEITVESPQEKLLMKADSDKLGRVFNNLVANAIKYGTNAKHIWLKADEQADQVILQVANDGISIDPADQEHLFDRFYRIEQSRSPQSGGTGLGLAIAQSLVQLQNGTIGVSSNEQQTTFEISLPKNLISEEE